MPRWIFALLAFSCMAAGLLVCTSQSLKNALHSQGPLHPWFHLLPFSLLALLLSLSFRRLPLSLLAVSCLLGVAWGTEFREHLADGWPVEQTDVLLDVAGIAVGTILGLAGNRLRCNPGGDRAKASR